MIVPDFTNFTLPKCCRNGGGLLYSKIRLLNYLINTDLSNEYKPKLRRDMTNKVTLARGRHRAFVVFRGANLDYLTSKWCVFFYNGKLKTYPCTKRQRAKMHSSMPSEVFINTGK